MKRLMTCVMAFTFSMGAMAAILPTVEAGSEEYDKTMCVERYANNCISTVCLTSEARDCQEQCRKEAEDKCREER